MSNEMEMLRIAVRKAMDEPQVLAAIEQVHGEIEQRIQEFRPTCQMSGRCCRFEEYGHRLFVTTAELAAFAVRRKEHPELDGLLREEDRGGCRFQQNRVCMAHVIRPMGCRLFFCDDRTESEMRLLYEAMHHKVKQIHDRFGIPYFYVEWRQALGAIADAKHPGGSPRA